MSKQDFQTSIEKRLASYGAMSLAVAAGFAAAPSAQAGVIFTDTSLSPGNSTATGPVYFNPALGTFGHSSTAVFRMTHQAAGSSCSRLGAFGMSSGAGIAGPAASQFLTKLLNGDVASFSNANFLAAGLLERSSSNVHQGNWQPGDDAYLGLVMTGPHYGWAHIQVLPGYQAELLGFAYFTATNDPGPGAGVPEPSSLMLLALGSAGIAAYRRKKNPRTA